MPAIVKPTPPAPVWRSRFRAPAVHSQSALTSASNASVISIPESVLGSEDHEALQRQLVEKFHGSEGLTMVFTDFIHGASHRLKASESRVLKKSLVNVRKVQHQCYEMLSVIPTHRRHSREVKFCKPAKKKSKIWGMSL